MQPHRPAQSSRGIAFVATVCGIAVGLAAGGALHYRHDLNLVQPLTVSARDCPRQAEEPSPGAKSNFHAAQDHRGLSAAQTSRGERWFCADADALAANWRRPDH